MRRVIYTVVFTPKGKVNLVYGCFHNSGFHKIAWNAGCNNKFQTRLGRERLFCTPSPKCSTLHLCHEVIYAAEQLAVFPYLTSCFSTEKNKIK